MAKGATKGLRKSHLESRNEFKLCVVIGCACKGERVNSGRW